jgi:vacuolar-type H+-ATPase subunit H
LDLLELIDQLEDTVLQGRQARFGGGWTVDRALLMELIDRMRSAVPAEVEDARAILRERNDVLARAEEDARIALTKARQEADNIVNSHDLVLDAQRRAGEMVEESREQATQLLEDARGQAARVRGEATTQAVEQALEADRYSLDMLQRLDAQLAAIQTSVRAGADQLETKVSRAEEYVDVEARDRAIREDSAATT